MLKPETVDRMEMDDEILATAGALAAYLGWLGQGPLRDVLKLSADDAEKTIRILLADGLLEAGDGPVWRFARLSDAPTISSNGKVPEEDRITQ